MSEALPQSKVMSEVVPARAVSNDRAERVAAGAEQGRVHGGGRPERAGQDHNWCARSPGLSRQACSIDIGDTPLASLGATARARQSPICRKGHIFHWPMTVAATSRYAVTVPLPPRTG